MDLIEMLNTAQASGKAYAVAVLAAAEGTTPRHPGSKMLIFEDGKLLGTIGGGEIEQFVITDARKCLETRQPALRTYPVIQTDGKESGKETIYIEPFFPRDRLILCGAGHVAGKLIPMAKSVGFSVTVIDIRNEPMVRERAAAADEFIQASAWGEGIAQVPESENDFLIACGFNFDQDEESLYHLLQRKSAYVGMLASQYKRKTIYNHLRERGIPEESLAKVHSPIGLDIGAETPEEIAVSILAELIRVRSERNHAAGLQQKE